jgi:hypothetical protein
MGKLLVLHILGARRDADVSRYDDWRLEKLRKLRQEVDPENRFGFFAHTH